MKPVRIREVVALLVLDDMRPTDRQSGRSVNVNQPEGDPALSTGRRRSPPAALAGKVREIGDVMSTVPASDWGIEDGRVPAYRELDDRLIAG